VSLIKLVKVWNQSLLATMLLKPFAVETIIGQFCDAYRTASPSLLVPLAQAHAWISAM